MSSRGKKKKLLRLQKENNQQGFINQNYFELPNPFENIPLEIRQEAIKNISEKAEADFPKLIDDLHTLLRNTDSIHLLCVLSFYYLTTFVRSNPKRKREKPIQQFHIELLQTFFLLPEFNNEEQKLPISPFDVEKVTELLQNIVLSFQAQQLKVMITSDLGEERKYLKFVTDSLRTHTLAVRNWAYPIHTHEILKGVFNPIDKKIVDKTGISVLTIIDFFEKLLEDIETKINEHFNKLKTIILLKDKTEFIKKYIQLFGVQDSLEQLLEISRKFDSRMSFKNYVISHSDLFLSDCYEIDVEKYTELFENNNMSCESIINSLSYLVGSLHDLNYKDAFLSNPIWERPFIKEGEKIFFPIPSLFQHINFHLLDKLLGKDDEISFLISKSRSDFLENEIEKTINTSFPDATIFRNIKWQSQNDGNIYETDFFIKIDTTVIIVEAKSGKFTDPAKRGAEKRIRKDFKSLVYEPAIQSSRFEKHLKETNGVIKSIINNNSIENITLGTILRIIKLSITLDFVPLSSLTRELIEAGIVDKYSLESINMSLADFKIVLELLGTASEKIHYLSRRFELVKNTEVIGDELDLLSFYLDTGFNLGEMEFNEVPLMLLGGSEFFDNYYVGKRNYRNQEKPVPKRTKWFQDIINFLESRKTKGWTEIAYRILSINYDDQIKIENAINNLAPAVLNKPDSKSTRNFLLYNTNTVQRSNFTIWYLHINETRDERIKKVKNVVSRELEKYKMGNALVVGYNVENPSSPYSFMAIIGEDDFAKQFISLH